MTNTAATQGSIFALRLKKAIAGYRARLSDSDNVVVMGLDSATSGRLAITYYRELTGSEFLDRIATGMNGVPGFRTIPRTINSWERPRRMKLRRRPTASALGKKQELRKATVERLLPCIVDARPLPRDLVESAVRRAGNRAGLETVGVGEMSGHRLCAGPGEQQGELSDVIGRRSNHQRLPLRAPAGDCGEHRGSGAVRCQGEAGHHGREADAAIRSHPFSTWRNIEIALGSLQRHGCAPIGQRFSLCGRNCWTPSSACSSRKTSRMTAKLSGEFLLGYHCQRAALWAQEQQR